MTFFSEVGDELGSLDDICFVQALSIYFKESRILPGISHHRKPDQKIYDILQKGRLIRNNSAYNYEDDLVGQNRSGSAGKKVSRDFFEP